MSDLIRREDVAKAMRLMSEAFIDGGSPTAATILNIAMDRLSALPAVTMQAQIDTAVAAEREWWITSLAPIKHQVEFYTRRTDLFRKGDQP